MHEFFLSRYPTLALDLKELDERLKKITDKDWDLVDSWADDYMIIFDRRLDYLDDANANKKLEKALANIEKSDELFWNYREQLDKHFGISVASWLSAPHNSTAVATSFKEAIDLCKKAFGNPFLSVAKDNFDELAEAMLDTFQQNQRIYDNVYFQNIIHMGDVALPYILKDLTRQPAIWLPALQTITGRNSLSDSLADIITDWLEWGISKRYLKRKDLEQNESPKQTIH